MLLITECRKCKGFKNSSECPFKKSLSDKLKSAGITKEIMRYRCHKFLEYEEFANLKAGDIVEFSLLIRDYEHGDYERWYTGKIGGALCQDKYYPVEIPYGDYKKICLDKKWEDSYKTFDADLEDSDLVDINVRMSNIIREVQNG